MKDERTIWQTLYQDQSMRLRMAVSDGNIRFNSIRKIAATSYKVYEVSIYILNVPKKGFTLRPVAFIIPVIKKSMHDLSVQLNKKHLSKIDIKETQKALTFKFSLWERANAESDQEKRLAKVLALMDKFKGIFEENMQKAIEHAKMQEEEL